MALYNKGLIQEAVNDKAWQKFRKSLKGMPTTEKLQQLAWYWISASPHECGVIAFAGNSNCYICIRVDNYIKALCRGGQLRPGCDVRWFTETPGDELEFMVQK